MCNILEWFPYSLLGHWSSWLCCASRRTAPGTVVLSCCPLTWHVSLPGSFVPTKVKHPGENGPSPWLLESLSRAEVPLASFLSKQRVFVCFVVSPNCYMLHFTPCRTATDYWWTQLTLALFMHTGKFGNEGSRWGAPSLNAEGWGSLKPQLEVPM